MKLTLLFCGIIMVAAINVTGQQLSPTVTSTSGGFYANQYGMLSFTTGELAAVETYGNPYFILTQGFQQPEDLITNVDDPGYGHVRVEVSPNPTSGAIKIVSHIDADVSVSLDLFNVVGTKVFTEQYNHTAGIDAYNVNLRHLSDGVYFMRLSFPNKKSQHEELIKINIIR